MSTTPFKARIRRAAAIAPAMAAATIACAQHHTLAHDPARTATTRNTFDTGPSSLNAPLWVFPASDPAVAGPIDWVPEASPVVTRDLVIAISRQNAAAPARMWAIQRENGRAAWSAELPPLVLDGWASPAIDPVNQTVLFAAGRPGSAGALVQARRLRDGHLLWSTALPQDVVNATIAITTDLAGRDRAFITGYEGFYLGGDGARLYCINLDPLRPQQQDGFPLANPHQPGDIVWSLPLNAGASGATPAYQDGRLYLATGGDFDFAAGGEVIAIDATASNATSAIVWRTDLGGDDASAGGIAIHRDALYAATYDFFGGRDSARLAKLDTATGAIAWTVPANRTASIPIPFAGDRILLSTGLPGFGSAPAVQIFQDLGNHAVLLEDSVTATWNDDGDGIIEPGEYLPLGGWSHQPHLVAQHPLTGGPIAFLGTLDPSGSQSGAFYTRLSMLDLTRSLSDPNAVLDHAVGGGSSPAIAHRSVYTIGPGGLHAFGLPFAFDVDQDGSVTIDDLYQWHAGIGARDIDRDGSVTDDDANALEFELRREPRGSAR